MTLNPGSKLGPYEVVGPLGAGGMGEVYRAKDTRLGRDVAIKVLPAEFSADPARKQRFEREAKTISGLNHPNICVLYDVGSQDGVDYLVMECVEGETLAKRLEKGALPVEQVVRYGAQIADALDKAHRAGIVHRDLKPGNIMLTPTGAKLLDFGLARGVERAASLATLTSASPLCSPITQEGMVVGTFQYMSPEQVEGKELDGRSDIFSLGAVLYEMLTGKRAFAGKSQLSVASAILEKEPEPISTTKPLTPAALDHAIRRCLAKDREERWQTTRDLGRELGWVGETGARSESAAATAKAASPWHRVVWIAGWVVALGLMATLLWWKGAKPAEETKYFGAPLPFAALDVALAPDGRTLALVAYDESGRKSKVWIYEVGSRGARELAGTDGATYPFWSPDGKSLAFFADGKLRRSDLAGGPVQTICDAPSSRGGTWNKDGVIVFAPYGSSGGGLYRVSAAGGVATAISEPDASRGEQSHRWPMFLPDGKHFIYMAANFSGRKDVDAIFVGALDSNEKHLLTNAGTNAAYADLGYLIFCRERKLFAQKLDLQQYRLTGEPVLLLDLPYQSQVKRAVFAAREGSLLIVQTGGQVTLSRLQWFNRKGEEVGKVGSPDLYGNVSLAPNGKMLAVDIYESGSASNADIWTMDLTTDNAKRLTFDPAFDSHPVWSPDAKRIVFNSNRSLRSDLYLKNADGGQQENALVHDDVNKWPDDWSRDGKYFLYKREADTWYLNLEQGKNQEMFKAIGDVEDAQFSPNGKWVAYASNETGKWEIYVTSFPEAKGRWQISVGGGEQPRWRGDGKELFYLSGDRKVMATPVNTEGNFNAGKSVALFQATPRQPISSNDQFAYDVSRDGERFIILTEVRSADSQPISLILNWDAELRKK